MNLVFAAGFLFPQRLFGQDYFRDVKAAYPRACFPDVPITASIADRADALARAIVAFDFPERGAAIHLVGHSMGGLDARYALYRNLHGLADRVASLSTIGTPHRGSPIADLIEGPEDAGAVRSMVAAIARRAAGVLGFAMGGLGNLTTAYARRFDAECPDIGGIPCFCYAGDRTEMYLLRAMGAYIRRVGRTPDERVNDGMVSLASAAWVPLAEPPWPADHFGEVGRTLMPPRFASPFPHLDALRRVIARAAAAAPVR